MSELIKLENIFKVYNPGKNEVRAVDGINLSVENGEFLSIVGKSGSGKSTLMNTLGCLDTPTSGNYYIDGKNTKNMNENELADIRNNKIGFIFQGFNLIAGLNAIENVELPLIYRGIAKSERRKLALNALTKVGLEDRIYHLPSEMSGGQQQRVAIARAIAASPSIILADEPTGNLDSKSGADIVKILKDLNNDGRTVILITHDEKVANIAKRKIKIKDGKIISDTNTVYPIPSVENIDVINKNCS